MDHFSAIVESQRESGEFVRKTGGLPEISRASTDLRVAIEATRREIMAAVFATRFPAVASNWFHEAAKGHSLSELTTQSVEEEGEAGFKRAHLMNGLTLLENDLEKLLLDLVELRTDLVVSQQEFPVSSEPSP